MSSDPESNLFKHMAVAPKFKSLGYAVLSLIPFTKVPFLHNYLSHSHIYIYIYILIYIYIYIYIWSPPPMIHILPLASKKHWKTHVKCLFLTTCSRIRF